MKIITVIGARPQFIKAAVLCREFRKREGIEEIILHTGQHFDKNMSDIFFDEMDISVPKYNLGISGTSHGAMTGEMLKRIEEVLILERPDWTLVYGDTNSTLAGALAAVKLHIPIAHVEAGLRSYNRRMPEEINRLITDSISDLLFCPTEAARKNLELEGLSTKSNKIHIVGDVMNDAALFYASKRKRNTIRSGLGIKPGYILLTLHRAENTDDKNRLKCFIDALNEIAACHPVICPLHPRTKSKISEYGLKPKFLMIPPVGYLDMIDFIQDCSLIVTDSGGLQKEAYFFKKNCVTLRQETEWIELVEKGFNILTNPIKEELISNVEIMLRRQNDFSEDLYGGGMAGQKIASVFASF